MFHQFNCVDKCWCGATIHPKSDGYHTQSYGPHYVVNGNVPTVYYMLSAENIDVSNLMMKTTYWRLALSQEQNTAVEHLIWF